MVGRIAPFADGPSRDSGGIVTGWLVQLTLLGAIFGVVAFDAIAVASTQVTVSDQGSTAASEAALAWSTSHDEHVAFEAAVKSAKASDAHNSILSKTFSVDRAGLVSFTMTREAHTLVFSRWSTSRRWAHVSRVAEGHPPAA